MTITCRTCGKTFSRRVRVDIDRLRTPCLACVARKKRKRIRKQPLSTKEQHVMVFEIARNIVDAIL